MKLERALEGPAPPSDGVQASLPVTSSRSDIAPYAAGDFGGGSPLVSPSPQHIEHLQNHEIAATTIQDPAWQL